MQHENSQFFNGILLGALMSGLIIGVVIIFLLVNPDIRLVNETVIDTSVLPHLDQEEQYPLMQLSHEIGMQTSLDGNVYRVQSAFYDSILNSTYRTLLDQVSGKQYPTIWDGEGEQLLYLGKIDLVTAAGGGSALIKEVHSQKELILVDDEGVELIYNLEEGMIERYDKEQHGSHNHGSE